MRNGKLGHIIPLLSQRNEIIVYPRLVLPGIVEIKALRLHVVRSQLLALELSYFFEKSLLVL